ncbi:MAG: serine/threonine protein kinase [Mucilaginibacter sp.]
MSKVFTITEGLENMGALRTGGQGSVYKGRRMGPIISAVKLLPTPIFTEDKSDKNLKAFENEVAKLKKVNEVPNPNVVKILNSGLTESGSFPFIEMEFIDGPDLEELLKPPHEKIFTIKETIKVADQLANALSHCHRVGVKHGDVKSNNVKYNIHSGNYVLLDFGMAIMSDEQRRTSMRHAGAIEFMAPEQNTGAMLFQTDIYSYGVILYELLAGQVPFPLADTGETSRNTVMIAHMESAVPDLMALRAANLPKTWPKEKKEQEMRVPIWLQQIIATCLEKDPEKRYASGMALQEAIIEGSVEAIITEGDTVVNTEAVIKDESKTSFNNRPMHSIDDDTVHVLRPIFYGMITLLVMSVGFSLYLLINKTAGKQPVTVSRQDSMALPKDTSSQLNAAEAYRERQRRRDSLIRKTILDEERKAAGEQPDSAITDTTGNSPGNN